MRLDLLLWYEHAGGLHRLFNSVRLLFGDYFEALFVFFCPQVGVFSDIADEMSCTWQAVVLSEARLIFIHRLIKELLCLLGKHISKNDLVDIARRC